MAKKLRVTRREFCALAGAFGILPNSISANRDRFLDVEGPGSLRTHGAAIGLPVGCAVRPELLDSTPVSRDPYTRTVVDQAGILVAENAMKWSSLRPSLSTFNFTQSDRLFEFASQNSQLVRGHNLCWHQQLPEWFLAEVTKVNAAFTLRNHIQTVAGRYAGKVHSWDVVNEAIHPVDGRPDGLRKSPWLALLGPEYIEMAFSAASEVDPKAKLTLNEYGIELDTPEDTEKRAQFLMLVRRLRARGVPLHALGIQSHLDATGPQPGTGLVRFIREAATLGLDVYITEMDVNTRALNGGPELQDTAVADVYRSYLGRILPEPNVKAVIFWGISNGKSWLNESHAEWAIRPDGSAQRPLPFDNQYAPTPAFFAIRQAIDSARRSRPSVDQGNADRSDPYRKASPYAPFTVPGSPGLPPSPEAILPQP